MIQGVLSLGRFIDRCTGAGKKLPKDPSKILSKVVLVVIMVVLVGILCGQLFYQSSACMVLLDLQQGAGLSSEKGLAAALAFSYEPMIGIEVEVIIEQIRSLTGSIEKLSETIKTQGEHLSGQKNLKSITGIGSLGASILM